jgi:glyoxylase I family protein
MPNNGHNATLRGGGFHHIAIRAGDFEATLKFYIEGLGFQRVYGWGEDGTAKGERDSRAVMLDTGDGNYLEVFAGGKRAPGEAVPEGALLHYALRTDDCDAALERARQAGATVTVETKTVPIAGDRPLEFRIAFVRGLDGEIIEFFQNDAL